jgi:hypothetical protein
MNLSFMGGGSFFFFCQVDSIHINTSPVAPFNMIKIKVSEYACNVKFILNQQSLLYNCWQCIRWQAQLHSEKNPTVPILVKCRIIVNQVR